MKENKEKIGYKDILKQKQYMKIVIAMLINRFGDAIDAIASTWIVYELTNKASWSALIYALNLLPSVFITPFAGAFVEKRSKKKIMVITDIIRALCVAYIATAYMLGFLQGWHLIITTLTISTVEAFRGPSSSALTPLVLDEKYYEYGMSLSMSLSTIVEMIGTASAAGIIAIIGSAGAIYVDMATFVISALIIMTINVTEASKLESKFEWSSYFTTLKEGFEYAFSLKTLLFLCFIAMFINAILVPFNSLQAPFVAEVLNGGASILSVLGIVLYASTILTSVLYPKIRQHISTRTLMISLPLSISIFYVGLIVCKPFYAYKFGPYISVSIFTFILGIVYSTASNFVSVETMKIVEPTYYARCGALLTSMSIAVSPLISFVVSVIAKFASVSSIFIGCGVVSIIATIVLFFSKTLKEMN